MSVDYEAYYGIGAQVKLVNLKEDQCPYEYISNKLINEDRFSYFETGQRSYDSRDKGKFFICLKNDYFDSFIQERLEELVGFINNHPDFEMIGEAGLVGGLHIH